MSGVGDVIGRYLLLVSVELMLAVMVVLAFLSPSEKVGLENREESRVGETGRISK